MSHTPTIPATATPAPTGPTSRPGSWAALADAIASDGIDRHDAAVRALISATGVAARAPAMARLVCDRSAPAVVRERAFGRLPWLIATAPHRRASAAAA